MVVETALSHTLTLTVKNKKSALGELIKKKKTSVGYRLHSEAGVVN